MPQKIHSQNLQYKILLFEDLSIDSILQIRSLFGLY
jgi:hypothetical protein